MTPAVGKGDSCHGLAQERERERLRGPRTCATPWGMWSKVPKGAPSFLYMAKILCLVAGARLWCRRKERIHLKPHTAPCPTKVLLLLELERAGLTFCLSEKSAIVLMCLWSLPSAVYVLLSGALSSHSKGPQKKEDDDEGASTSLVAGFCGSCRYDPTTSTGAVRIY